MRLVIQRVLEASVEAEGAITGSIGPGLLVLFAVESSDTTAQADYLVKKTIGLRIFPDAQGKMNRSVADVGGAVLVVSQFTLFGDCSQGLRPSYSRAATAQQASSLYEYYLDRLRQTGIPVQSGVFQAAMKVTLINDGPVTLICDSILS
ncbi:MAG: D-tyrosyl-tRNA(Tyr) deacylase [Bryobacteraceae bacterium]|nr:D-tyrosyl-tRNA(Tyr) deacylase [Bryobacteraceae bacterium]